MNTKRRDPWDRFWEKVIEATEPSPNGMEGCWLWTAMLSNGYGFFYQPGRSTRMHHAHRVAYEWITGKVPEGLVIDHLCRNRRCVNPAHLEAVSNRENILRGTGWAARHARKTHCPAGHPLSGDNLMAYELARGQRKCRICHRVGERVRSARVRAQQRAQRQASA